MSDKKLKFRLFANYFITTFGISLVLMIVGIVFIFYLNTQNIVKKAKEELILTILLKDDISEKQIEKISNWLSQQSFIKTLKFTSKQEALEEVQTALGEDVKEILDYNPLPPSFDITLKQEYANKDSIVKIKNKLIANPLIVDVFYNQSIVNQLDKNVKIISSLMLSFASVILIISLFLINNTLRLSFYAKRKEIKIMRLFGANWWFILKPFLKRSFTFGIIASLLAILVITWLLVVLKYSLALNLQYVLKTYLIIIAVGLIISVFSTFFIVFSYIRKPEETVYI